VDGVLLAITPGVPGVLGVIRIPGVAGFVIVHE
jgi:hypothetical protein